MPLFPCRRCLCIENTACCYYWSRKSSEKELLCSACDPEIGKWHEVFEKRTAVGMLVDDQGHLWSKTCVDTGGLPAHYKIVGEVAAPSNTDSGSKTE